MTTPSPILRLLLLAGWLCAAAGTARAGLEVRLRDEAAVRDRYVRLGDVAELPADEPRAAHWAGIFLGRAPEAGARAELTRWQVESRLLAHGLEAEDFRLTGARRVRLQRLAAESAAAAPASAARVAEAPAAAAPEAPAAGGERPDPATALKKTVRDLAARHIRKLYGGEARVEVEIRDLDYPEAPLKKAASLEIEEAPAELGSRYLDLAFSLRDARRRALGRVEARCAVEVSLPVVLARQAVPRGALVSEAVLYREYAPLRRAARAYSRVEQVVGKEARRALRAAEPIQLGAVVEPALVVTGQIVRVRARAGRMSIVNQAVALQDGCAGDVIKVRNQSGRGNGVYAARVLPDGRLVLAGNR